MAEIVNDGIVSPQKLPSVRVRCLGGNQHMLQSALILVEAGGSFCTCSYWMEIRWRMNTILNHHKCCDVLETVCVHRSDPESVESGGKPFRRWREWNRVSVAGAEHCPLHVSLRWGLLAALRKWKTRARNNYNCHHLLSLAVMLILTGFKCISNLYFGYNYWVFNISFQLISFFTLKII